MFKFILQQKLLCFNRQPIRLNIIMNKKLFMVVVVWIVDSFFKFLLNDRFIFNVTFIKRKLMRKLELLDNIKVTNEFQMLELNLKVIPHCSPKHLHYSYN